ncbi:MAG: rhomboid family intramembrane serine protease [Blastocatellia bacterium]|nr:rhomboid family intramembrane serine protease [Blastocatellia bacterium]
MNSELPPHEQFHEAFYARRVWLAYAILAFNVLLFGLMLKTSLLPWRWTLVSGTDHATLLNFGAKTNHWVLQQRQWFRLVTPIFLHIGLLHLIANAYALWIVGPIIERLFGSARFALLYLLAGMGGIAGSLLGARINRLDAPVAGSSGALFGLFGVLLVVGYKYRHELPAAFRRAFTKSVWIVVALNLAFGIVSNFGKSFSQRFKLPLHFVDNWGHVGGLLTGAILAMILPYLGPERKLKTGKEIIVLAICLLVVSYCYFRAYQLRPFIWQK